MSLLSEYKVAPKSKTEAKPYVCPILICIRDTQIGYICTMSVSLLLLLSPGLWALKPGQHPHLTCGRKPFAGCQGLNLES